MSVVNSHNRDSEAYVLSCIIQDNSLYLDAMDYGLSEFSFWIPAHRLIWEVLSELLIGGKGADEIIIFDRMRVKRIDDGASYIDLAGGPQGLGSVCEAAQHTAHFTYHLEKVISHQSERKLSKSCSEALAVSQEEVLPVEERISKVEAILSEISGEGIEKSFKNASETIGPVVEHLKKLNRKEVEPGLSTGYIDIDRLIGCMRRQNIIVMAARPGMGKTAIGLNIAQNVCEDGGRVLFFSFEMGADQLLSRMACSMAKVPYKVIADGLASDQQMSDLLDCRDRIQKFDMPILDNQRMDCLKMQSRARALHRKDPCDLIVVDYLQKIPMSGRFRSREEEVSIISGNLTALAKELNIPILVLAQLNRDSEKEKRYPRAADLRESGAIEQDAHVITMLSKVNSKGEDLPSGEVHVVCVKNRDWSTGMTPMTFVQNLARFENYVREHEH